MSAHCWRVPVIVLLVSLLGACAWFKGPRGPVPAALPEVRASVEIQPLWQVDAGGIDGTLLRPATSGDAVFAGGRNGTLIRLSVEGREEWRTRSVPNLTGGVGVGPGVVAVGSSEGLLAAHDANTGALLWKVQTGGELGGTPFVGDTLVVARVGDSQLEAYAVADGKRLWTYQRGQSPLSLRTYSGMARAGDLLLAGFPGGKLVALTLAGGFPRWEATIAVPRGSNELERMSDVTGDPVVSGDSVCVAAFQGRIACVDREKGNLLWTRDYSSSNGVLMDDKAMVFADSTGAVFSLDAQTGATIWKQDRLQHRGVGRPAFVAGKIAVTDRQGWLHLLDPMDGHFVGQYRVDSSGIDAPMLSLANGRLAAQGRSGRLSVVSVRH